jgi:hypothetical protein
MDSSVIKKVLKQNKWHQSFHNLKFKTSNPTDETEILKP